jgi:hypothetical protein
MERIVIEVDEAIAKKWENVSPEMKGQLEKNIEKQNRNSFPWCQRR